MDKRQIKFVTMKELTNQINNNLSKKAPGYDLITGNILKELSRKGLVKFLHLINVAIRLKYISESWKIVEIIMIPKPGKSENEFI